MILGVTGVCRGTDLWALELKNIQYFEDNKLTITLFNKINLTNRVFTHKGVWSKLIKNYVDLRPQDIETSRLFLHYQHGKCTKIPIGKCKIAKWPCIIAKFLKLPKPELYTEHCFRTTNTSLFAKRVKHIRSQKNSKIACTKNSTGQLDPISSASSNIIKKIEPTTPDVTDKHVKHDETIDNTNTDSLEVDPLNISDLTPPLLPLSQCHDNFSTSTSHRQETNYHFLKCKNYFSDESDEQESNTLNDDNLSKLIPTVELTEIKKEHCDDDTANQNDNNPSVNMTTLSTNCFEIIDEIENNASTIDETTPSLINDTVITDEQSNQNDNDVDDGHVDDDNNYAKKEHEIKLKILNLELKRAEIQLQTARNELNYSEINIRLIKSKANNQLL